MIRQAQQNITLRDKKTLFKHDDEERQCEMPVMQPNQYSTSMSNAKRVVIRQATSLICSLLT